MLNNFLACLTVAFMDIKENEEGQGLVEYALILLFVSIVSIGVLTLLGGSVRDVFSTVNAAL